MSKPFKVGDEVEYVGSSEHFVKRGTRGTVITVPDPAPYYRGSVFWLAHNPADRANSPKGKGTWWASGPENLRHVKPSPKFKVGDRVKLLPWQTTLPTSEWYTDNVNTVVPVITVGERTFNFQGKNGFTWMWEIHAAELITQPAPEVITDDGTLPIVNI